MFSVSLFGKYNKVSNIKRDEHLVFFRTSAWLDEATDRWHLPIHGWVYEPQKSLARRITFEKILKRKYSLIKNMSTERNFDQRINLLIADNERGKRIVLRLGDKKYTLAPSRPNGHFKTVLTIPRTELADSKDNIVRYSAVIPENDPRVFEGESQLVGPEGKSVISDIDDTVKISHVVDKKRLMEHTFFLDFFAVEGMPELYRRWAHQNISFHYVSSSPWQLYTPLTAFLSGHEFPWASLSLKTVRFRDRSLFNLFMKGTKTKPIQIETLLQAYPKRQFTLVGDSGEQDPEVYADIARRYPKQIEKIYIRDITGLGDSKNFEPIFDGLSRNIWTVFASPGDIQALSDINH